MQITSKILFYSAVILIIGLVLKTLGVFHTNIPILISFVFILSGLGLFANYFGSHKVFVLTASAMIFYSGFLLLLKHYFSIDLRIFSFIPNVMLIAGLNFTLLFIENSEKKVYLLLAGGLILLFFIISLLLHTISFLQFGYYLYKIAHTFWFFMVLLFIFLTIIMREKH